MSCAYPTVEDFARTFADSGLGECLPASIGDALWEARGDWERETDWGPYLSSGEVETRAFDAPRASNRLPLHTGLLTLSSLLVNGLELTERRDFWLQPANSSPFTSIRFGRPLACGPQGIEISGVWGAVDSLPVDVFGAVLLRAAWKRRDVIAAKWKAQTAEAQKSVLRAKESGPVRLEYAPIDGGKLLDLNATFDAWDAAWAAALRGRVMTQP